MPNLPFGANHGPTGSYSDPKSGSRTCQWLDVPGTRFLGSPFNGDIASESTGRRLCQNFAEAAGDNHVLAGFQHPNTHHNLVCVFGDASARLRGAGRGI